MRKLFVSIIAIFYCGASIGGDVNLLVEIKTDKSFKTFIESIETAIKKKDANFIYNLVSDTFYLHRDFGGTYDKKSSNIENFGWAIQLDNSQLREEYKDQGWKKLKKFLTKQEYEYSEFTNYEICTPAGALEKENPEPQLCFTRTNKGKWLISSYIFGGD